MDEADNRRFTAWVKRHWKMLAIIGGSVLLVALAVVLVLALSWRQQDADTGSGSGYVNDTTEPPLLPAVFDEFPQADASTATQPLLLAFYRDSLAKTFVDLGEMRYTQTHQAYTRLINKEVDLAIVTQPSDEEQAMATQAGVELNVQPIVNEGFVFLVAADNPVESLSLQQVKDIYAGRITNWSEVGGQDQSIVAYQRPINSGSQTGMLDIMGSTPMTEPPKDGTIGGMGELIESVSSFSAANSNAIGYSYYYYATTMYAAVNQDVADGVKLLAVDGTAPTPETIQNKSYPLTDAYYLVTRGDEQAAVRDYILSERGQKVACAAGYVPLEIHCERPTTTPDLSDGMKSLTEKQRQVKSMAWYYCNNGQVGQPHDACSEPNSLDSLMFISAMKNKHIEDDLNKKMRDICRATINGKEDLQHCRAEIVGNGLVSFSTTESDAVFRLDNGEEIGIRDIFTKGSLRQALARGRGQTDYDRFDCDTPDGSDDPRCASINYEQECGFGGWSYMCYGYHVSSETVLANVVQAIERQPKGLFSLGIDYLFIRVSDFELDLFDVWPHVAIFDRFSGDYFEDAAYTDKEVAQLGYYCIGTAQAPTGLSVLDSCTESNRAEDEQTILRMASEGKLALEANRWYVAIPDHLCDGYGPCVITISIAKNEASEQELRDSMIFYINRFDDDSRLATDEGIQALIRQKYPSAQFALILQS